VEKITKGFFVPLRLIRISNKNYPENKKLKKESTHISQKYKKQKKNTHCKK